MEFLHNNGILHRDLKPENLVFDKRGYIRLTDMGVARVWKPENCADTSGTPGYMGIYALTEPPKSCAAVTMECQSIISHWA